MRSWLIKILGQEEAVELTNDSVNSLITVSFHSCQINEDLRVIPELNGRALKHQISKPWNQIIRSV